jgi:hypothetical protein
MKMNSVITGPPGAGAAAPKRPRTIIICSVVAVGTRQPLMRRSNGFFAYSHFIYQTNAQSSSSITPLLPGFEQTPSIFLPFYFYSISPSSIHETKQTLSHVTVDLAIGAIDFSQRDTPNDLS